MRPLAAALCSLALAAAAQTEPATLVIRSEPPGAQVEIDALPVGTTPYQGKLGPGLHLLSVRLEGYEPYQLDFVMPAGRDLELPVPPLKPLAARPAEPAPPPARPLPTVVGTKKGLLHVTTHPPGAQITVDGHDVGTSPASVEVSPGMHAVAARLHGYRAAEGDAAVGAGEESAKRLELVPEPVPLRVDTEPPGASVFVDDKEVGSTPYFSTLIVGTHWVKTKLAGHKPREQKVEAVAATPIALRWTLEKGFAHVKKKGTQFSAYTYENSITANPLMLVGGLVHAQYERAVGESLAVVGGAAIKAPFGVNTAAGFFVHGGVNYYFGHLGGAEFDGFHVGGRVHLGVSTFGGSIGFGLLGGYKMIFGPGVTVSLGLGFDVLTGFPNPALPILQADVGYTF